MHDQPLVPAAAAIPVETLQSLGLAGRVQLELQRQRWLEALPQAASSLPDDSQLSALVQAYLADLGMSSNADITQWMQQEGLGEAELKLRAWRHEQWLQLCDQQCGKQLASYFLQRKSDLDEVVYTVLAVAEQELCSELYLQIREAETSFETLLQQLPPQPELGPRGRFGPVPLSELPDGLAQLLRVSQPGQLWPPKPIQQGWVVVRLDESRPAVLDQPLRRRLLLELGQRLLTQQPPQENRLA